MPIALLTLLKLLILVLLYLFVFRAVRTVATDLYGGTGKRRPAPRPRVAQAEAPRRSRKIPRELVLHPPEGKPTVVSLDSTRVVLGRGGNSTVKVDDVYISDEHAEVMPDDGGWSVRDLGSTNGTYLNGAKVTLPRPLAACDQLRVGKTRIELRR
ncbi:MAG: FHA domain-containing protein [Nitriliruptorales bacterium]|nr:FHA domain-containing protein [Nitriliruptorales bacterium]